MIKKLTAFIIVTVFFACTQNKTDNSLTKTLQNYPRIAKQIDTSTYWGNSIIDPYRNLENAEDSIAMQWYESQGDFYQ